LYPRKAALDVIYLAQLFLNASIVTNQRRVVVEVVRPTEAPLNDPV
jgi:hypothetical protein